MRCPPNRRAVTVRGEFRGQDRRGAAAETCNEENMSFRESVERIKDKLVEKLDVIIIGLIIYSAVTIALETISGLSPGGRLIAGLIVLICLGVVAVPSGLFAVALTSVGRAEEREASRRDSTKVRESES